MANAFVAPAKSIVVAIEVIKGNGKDNVSMTQSATVNITGRVVSCSGLVLRGKDVSDQTVGGRITMCMSEEWGAELAQATADVYAERALNNDPNPVLLIQFTCSSLSAASGGFIGKSITDVEVVSDYESEQDPDTFIALAGAIREQTAQASAEALEAATLRKKQVRNELTAGAVQDKGLFSVAKNFLNTPIGAKKEVATPVTRPIVKRK